VKRAIALALVAGCGGGHAVSDRLPLAKSPADDESVVATVDGRAIRAADVARQARASGQSARAALDALIEAEAAAGEAERRGFVGDADVAQAAKQSMVRRFLAETFEKDVTPASVSEAELRAEYEKRKWRLVHPEMRELRQILAPTALADDADRRQLLRARMEEVALAAKEARTPEAFEALAKRFSDGEITLAAQSGFADRDAPTVKPFDDAAWAIAKPGQSSGVVETGFGFHVIYYARYLPAENHGYDEAREHLRADLWPQARRREFARFVDALVEKHHVELRPQLLEAAE